MALLARAAAVDRFVLAFLHPVVRLAGDVVSSAASFRHRGPVFGPCALALLAPEFTIRPGLGLGRLELGLEAP